jgi:hypothetical protein
VNNVKFRFLVVTGLLTQNQRDRRNSEIYNSLRVRGLLNNSSTTLQINPEETSDLEPQNPHTQSDLPDYDTEVSQEPQMQASELPKGYLEIGRCDFVETSNNSTAIPIDDAHDVTPTVGETPNFLKPIASVNPMNSIQVEDDDDQIATTVENKLIRKWMVLNQGKPLSGIIQFTQCGN